MNTGKSGKELNQVRQYMKTHESCKTHCCQAQNTEQREEATAKMKLIRILSHTIQQIAEMEEGRLEMKEGKVKFRQYQRAEWNGNQLRAIDVTIEA